MSGDLLQTKLNVPEGRSCCVSRPRLKKKLEVCLEQDCKLTLISAPAGFGKTTLVSRWVNQVDRPVSWLSLDENDNDSNRFLMYVVAALQTVHINVGSGFIALFQSSEAVDIEVVLTTLINEISELDEDIVLILDDYHIIESQEVDDAVDFLLAHLPVQLHLIIVSRFDPSLSLSRLRGSGQINEIRANDLRFTIEEASEFLNEIAKLDLTAQEISSLEARTEGWIAGLQLAAISIQGFDGDRDVTHFIDRFAGSDRYIQDYLVDEVLAQQPQEITDFLLKTSILKRMCTPLCDAVLYSDSGETAVSQSSSREKLDYLEATNLFIVALDNERNWYRYHHLFSSLLQQRLKNSYPHQISNLNRHASDWFEQAGLLDDAIAHAKVSGSPRQLVNIIEFRWQELIHKGDVDKLKRLLDFIGPYYVKKSAPLSIAYCWIYIFTDTKYLIPGHLANAKKARQTELVAENGKQPINLAVIPSLIETLEATLALDNNQAKEAKIHALEAISLIPEDPNPAVSQLLYGAAAYRLALAYRKLGEFEQSCCVLLEGLDMLMVSENYLGAAATVLQVIMMYKQLDRTDEARILCEKTLQSFIDNGREKTPPSGLLKVILANFQADSGELELAQLNLESGRRYVKSINSQTYRDVIATVADKLENQQSSTNLVAPLSPRELEVLQLVSEGYSNQEIGDQLFLALNTIKGHNRNIYSKLGVRSRTQAVKTAVSLKLIPSH